MGGKKELQSWRIIPPNSVHLIPLGRIDIDTYFVWDKNTFGIIPKWDNKLDALRSFVRYCLSNAQCNAIQVLVKYSSILWECSDGMPSIVGNQLHVRRRLPWSPTVSRRSRERSRHWFGGNPPLMIWVTHRVPVTPVAVKATVAMLSFVEQSTIPMI